MTGARTDLRPEQILELSREVLAIEAQAILTLRERIGIEISDAVELIFAARGRVVVSGIGKSGHIARKVASTLASTGTPAFFVHPAEAGHGDLGMIAAEDVFLAFSNSGESAELLAILPSIKRRGARCIAVTGNPGSNLARQADVHLNARVEQEACPLGLAPTASTTAALALGDALAVALLRARGFGADDFARSHPGGSLGRRLLVRVCDVMHRGPELPAVPESAYLPAALIEMSGKGLGMTAVVDVEGRAIGIFTDGDLRRALEKDIDVRRTPIGAVMHPNPHTIDADKLAAEAVQRMEALRINGLLVTDREGRLVGALNTHDLFRAGVI